MGLINTEVEVRLNGKTTSRYESLGYNIPRRFDEYGRYRVEKNATITVNVYDLSPHSNVKVSCRCDNCSKEYEIQWTNYNKGLKEDGKIYCNSCSSKLYGYELARLSQVRNGTSFEQWCLNNKRQDILERWDYDLNKYKPNEIGCSSKLEIWFKCPNKIHKSEIKNISLVTRGWKNSISCNGCNSIGQFLINTYGKNAIDMYWSNKNTIDAFEISCGINTKIWLICQNCGNDKKIRFSDFINYGFGCPKCSDGISYPNKIAYNLLEQLNIEFIPEYSPNWIDKMRYDFYFEKNNFKYILEMDGGWHKKDNKLSGQTKEQSQAIDDYKDQLARSKNIEVIRIDCEKSELEYIKTNLFNSLLSKLFNLSKVDWIKCNEYACKSLVKTTCNIWNIGDITIQEISKMLKVSGHTIRNYLKQGTKLGWCYYNPEEELKKSFKNLSKKVYCFELDRIFNSTMDIQRELGIFNSNISACCLGKTKSSMAGGYHWIYYDDFLKLK